MSEIQPSNEKKEYQSFIPGTTQFIDDQVILTGKSNEVELLRGEAGTLGIHLNPVPSRFINIGDFKSSLPAGYDVPEIGTTYENIQIALYDIVEGPGDNPHTRVWKVIEEIYKLANKNNILVFADPNYIACDPNPTGGSGHISGAPGGGMGKIINGISNGKSVSDNLGGQSVKQTYEDHWAFKSPQKSKTTYPASEYVGINLKLSEWDQHPAEIHSETDETVKVIIFDTYDPGLVNANNPKRANEVIPAAGMDEIITIQHPYVSANGLQIHVECPPFKVNILDDGHPLDDYDDHGGYVAGLVHRVAPHADLNLVSVLGKQTLGELFFLLEQLWNVLGKGSQRQPGISFLHNIVINLSLEALCSEKEMNSYEIQTELRKMLSIHSNSSDPQVKILKDILENQFYTPCLRIIIQVLYYLGAVIVAAAGNDGNRHPSPIQSAIPGRYPEVISVMASNSEGKLSHFSNLGDVAAPGGGLSEALQRIPTLAGKNLEELCESMQNVTPHAMIGLVPCVDAVYDPPVGTDRKLVDHGYPHGLAFWWGTSFATPLVSGLAALLLEKKNINPQEVKDIITQPENTNDGVIDVRKVLA